MCGLVTDRLGSWSCNTFWQIEQNGWITLITASVISFIHTLYKYTALEIRAGPGPGANTSWPGVASFYSCQLGGPADIQPVLHFAWQIKWLK